MRQPPPKQVRIPELDGVRGLAILMIVFSHYVYGSAHEHDDNFLTAGIRNIFPLSWSGVDLFFVLSGFLIGGILIDQRGSKGFFGTFYLRRACRILPLYWVWITLFFLLSRLLSAHASSQWYAINFRTLQDFPSWCYYFFLQNFQIARIMDFGATWVSITWSLCVEEQFYLLMPLIILLVPPRRLPIVLICLLPLGIACRIFFYLYFPSIFTYVLLPCRADGLLLGVLCASVVRNPKWKESIPLKKDWLYLLLGILSVGMSGLTIFSRKLDTGSYADRNSFEMIFGYFWIDAFYACLLLVTISAQTSLLARFMRMPLMRHFGILSYNIYLTHNTVLGFLCIFILGRNSTNIVDFSSATVTLLAFSITWLLALFSWHYFEKPIITWGHSFAYDRNLQ